MKTEGGREGGGKVTELVALSDVPPEMGAFPLHSFIASRRKAIQTVMAARRSAGRKREMRSIRERSSPNRVHAVNRDDVYWLACYEMKSLASIKSRGQNYHCAQRVGHQESG